MTVNITLNEISVNNAKRVLELFNCNSELAKFTKETEAAYRDMSTNRTSHDAVAKASDSSTTVESTSNIEQPKTGQRKTDDNSDTAYTIEDIRAAFSVYAKAKGKDKAKELLAKFGASKVTTLKTDDYMSVMNEIKE